MLKKDLPHYKNFHKTIGINRSLSWYENGLLGESIHHYQYLCGALGFWELLGEVYGYGLPRLGEDW